MFGYRISRLQFQPSAVGASRLLAATKLVKQCTQPFKGPAGAEKFRIGRQRLVVGRERLVEPLQRFERVAAIVEGIGVVWFDLKRTLVAVQRGIEALELLEDIAVIVVRHRLTWVRLNDAPQQACRLFYALRPRSDDPQQVQRVKMISSRRQYLSTPPLRLDPFATAICHGCLLHGLRDRHRHLAPWVLDSVIE
jgi:hypothetical protein